MTKSYKMVILYYMLERDSVDWTKSITPEDAAPFFHEYYTEKEYRKRVDFSDKNTHGLWKYDKKKISKLIAMMPMSMWSGGSKGLVTFEDNHFSLNIKVLPEDLELLQ